MKMLHFLVILTERQGINRELTGNFRTSRQLNVTAAAYLLFSLFSALRNRERTGESSRSRKNHVLADPKAAFGAQNVAPIFSRAALAAAGPAFTRTIDAVSARLTTQVVRRLNASVEVDKRDPADVAHRFLSSHRLA